MNEPVPWHDPVIDELHAIREQLAQKHRGDLLAYSRAAQARCDALGLTMVDDQTKTAPIETKPAAET